MRDPGLLKFSPHTVLLWMQARQVQTKTSDNPDVLRPVPFANPTVIFLERHVQHSMCLILHFPMTAYSLRRSQRHGTDIVLPEAYELFQEKD